MVLLNLMNYSNLLVESRAMRKVCALSADANCRMSLTVVI